MPPRHCWAPIRSSHLIPPLSTCDAVDARFCAAFNFRPHLNCGRAFENCHLHGPMSSSPPAIWSHTIDPPHIALLNFPVVSYFSPPTVPSTPFCFLCQYSTFCLSAHLTLPYSSSSNFFLLLQCFSSMFILGEPFIERFF